MAETKTRSVAFPRYAEYNCAFKYIVEQALGCRYVMPPALTWTRSEVINAISMPENRAENTSEISAMMSHAVRSICEKNDDALFDGIAALGRAVGRSGKRCRGEYTRHVAVGIAG